MALTAIINGLEKIPLAGATFSLCIVPQLAMAHRPLALLALCASLAVASCASENPTNMSSAGSVTDFGHALTGVLGFSYLLCLRALEMLSPALPAPREPAPIRLIGAGLGRTATSSLKTALTELGYQVQGIPEEGSFPALGLPGRGTDAIADPSTPICCARTTPFPHSRALRMVRTRLTGEVSQNWHKC